MGVAILAYMEYVLEFDARKIYLSKISRPIFFKTLIFDARCHRAYSDRIANDCGLALLSLI